MPEINGQYAMNPQLAQAKANQSQPQQPEGKVHATDAKYKDSADNCASCSHFQGDGQPCDVLVEPVSSQGWCSLYSEGQPNASPQQGNAPGISDSAAQPGPAQLDQPLAA